MAKIKITFTDGVVDSYEFAVAVKETLQEEGFEFVNNGYNPMHDRIIYYIKKDDEFLGEVGLARKLSSQEALWILKKIKEIKDSYTPLPEELEFDL